VRWERILDGIKEREIENIKRIGQVYGVIDSSLSSKRNRKEDQKDYSKCMVKST
jgi:hypothetical protein